MIVLVVLNMARTAIEASRLTHASFASVRSGRCWEDEDSVHSDTLLGYFFRGGGVILAMAGEKPCVMMTSQSADDTLDTLAAVHGSEDLFCLVIDV